MGQVEGLKSDKKMKDTPIGQIPVDWSICHLGEISSFEYGVSLPDKTRKSGDIPVFGSNGIVGCHDEPAFNGPGIIVGRKGTVGAVQWSDCDFTAIDTTYAITKNETKQHLKWLYYLLIYSKLDKLNAATGVPGLNRNEAYSTIVPLPPFIEQKKIAEILTNVDNTIHKTDHVIKKSKELKKGLMQKLLTKGIGHKEFVKTSVGLLPKSWSVKKLSQVCLGAPEYGANIPAIDKNLSLPRYIRITDITEDGVLLNETWQSIDSESAEPYILSEGDLLFARSGATVGKTYLYRKKDGNCAFAGYLIRFRPDPKHLLPAFAFHFTHSFMYYAWVENMLRAGAQPNINAKEYSGLKIPIPPIEEQRKISNILSFIDATTCIMIDNRSGLARVKSALMQVLLTGIIRTV